MTKALTALTESSDLSIIFSYQGYACYVKRCLRNISILTSSDQYMTLLVVLRTFKELSPAFDYDCYSIYIYYEKYFKAYSASDVM